jgi:ech hydrogenase subunit E
MDADTLKAIVDRLLVMQEELKSLTDVFIEDYSVRHRLVGVGCFPARMPMIWALSAP